MKSDVRSEISSGYVGVWWLINAIGNGSTPVPLVISAHKSKGKTLGSKLVSRFNSECQQ